jgi:hypothetical protein
MKTRHFSITNINIQNFQYGYSRSLFWAPSAAKLSFLNTETGSTDICVIKSQFLRSD